MTCWRFYPLAEHPQWGVVSKLGKEPKAAEFIPHSGRAQVRT